MRITETQFHSFQSTICLKHEQRYKTWAYKCGSVACRDTTALSVSHGNVGHQTMSAIVSPAVLNVRPYLARTALTHACLVKMGTWNTINCLSPLDVEPNTWKKSVKYYRGGRKNWLIPYCNNHIVTNDLLLCSVYQASSHEPNSTLLSPVSKHLRIWA